MQCIAPEKIHTHSMKGHWKFQGGGSHKSQNFRLAKYEAKLEFPVGIGGGGCKTTTDKRFFIGYQVAMGIDFSIQIQVTGK